MSNSYFTLTEKAVTSTAIAETAPEYNGSERRFLLRRCGEDRRREVRFEINKDDRRANEGRRSGDRTPKFW